MAHHFEYDFDHGILLVALSGHVSYLEIYAYHEEVRRMLGARKLVAAISDLAEVTSADLPGHMVWGLATRDAFVFQRVPRYIVAPQDSLYGIARMYELASNYPEGFVEVVRTRNAAIKALGVESLNLQPLRLPTEVLDS